MSELISREWLEDAFDNLCCHNCKICRNFRNEDSFYKCALIDNAPTVEPDMAQVLAYESGKASAERPQGEWKTNLTTGDIFCSCCKEVRRDSRIKHINFCNSCGAKMPPE